MAVLTSPANGAHFSPSVRPEDVEKINPLLAFDGSLETTAQIIRQVLRDPATKKELGVGPDAQQGVDYEVTNGDATTSGPFLFIDVTSESPATSEDMTVAVVKRSVQELESRQKAVGAPPQTFITAEVLVKPTVPEAQIYGKLGMRSVVGPHSDIHLRCSVRARQRAHGTEGARVPGEPCGKA